MNMDLKKIASGLILIIGLFAFIVSISNNNLNFALIYLSTTLIFWVLYGLLLDAFDVRIFAGIISASGFLIAISILFMFGIGEVPFPVGAIIFHSGGIAIALSIGLFSLFPILILYQMGTTSIQVKPKARQDIIEKEPEPVIISEEWEIASDNDFPLTSIFPTIGIIKSPVTDIINSN